MTHHIAELERGYADMTDKRTALYLKVQDARYTGAILRTDEATLEGLDKAALKLARQIAEAYGFDVDAIMTEMESRCDDEIPLF